jgi:hypothetical protein
VIRSGLPNWREIVTSIEGSGARKVSRKLGFLIVHKSESRTLDVGSNFAGANKLHVGKRLH